MSGLPVLGVVPEGSDAATLLNEYRHGEAVRHGEYKLMSEYIRNVYENRSTSKSHKEVNLEANYKYSTEAMAEKYAELLNKILP